MTDKKTTAPGVETGDGTESSHSISLHTTLPQGGKEDKAEFQSDLPGSTPHSIGSWPQSTRPTSIAGLKQMRIWLCWNAVLSKDGRITKKPIAATGESTGTDEAHRGTWVTYDEAVAAAQARSYTGIGFVIPEGYAFLDIDHRALDDPLVRDLLSLLPGYAEYSVSGNGIHVYMQCDLSRLPVGRNKKGVRSLDSMYYMKNPHNQVELYVGGLTNRYAVFTGKAINDLEITDCTDGLMTVLDSYMLKDRKKTISTASKASERKAPAENNATDPEEEAFQGYEVVQALRRQRNAEKFSRLYDRGDLKGYSSQSEADLALCTLIAFQTGDRPELIDRIFQDSALYRDKWDRDDYRDRTIRMAIESAEKAREELPPFLQLSGRSKVPVLVPSILATYIRENTNYILVRDDGRNITMPYVYRDGVYRFCQQDMFLGIIKEPVEHISPEYVSMPKIREAYQQLMTDLRFVGQEELNRDEDIINFRNGLLRVTADSLKLEEHSPRIYSTIQIPCDWTGRQAATPVFDRYLKTLTNGDEKTARLLMEFIGVCISNVKGWRMKKALFLIGAGDTGKSQLKALTERLLGKGNYVGIDLKDIEARFGTGVIYNTRLAGSSDMSYLTVEELKTFKKITGGDSIFAEFKGQQGFSYTYGGLLWFCMNRLPRFGGDNGKWVYDRIMIVECQNVIPLDQQDKQLPDKLYAEREGILFKAVEALQTVIRNGYRFSESPAVTRARETYIRENSSPVEFFHECMCRRKDQDYSDRCTVSTIYNVYRRWCSNNQNGYPKSRSDFRSALVEHLGRSYDELTVHREDGTYYIDYTLKEEASSGRIFDVDNSFL